MYAQMNPYPMRYSLVRGGTGNKARVHRVLER
jgi:hypothetical protein